MRNIILFGPMGAGKTTVAKIIDDCYGYYISSLGQKIHEECKLHGDEKREEMQKYGQAMREIFGVDVWNDYLIWVLNRKLNHHMKLGLIVIDDGRQLNEYDYWTQKGFIAVGVLANENIRTERLLKRTGRLSTPEELQHDTEQQALKCVNKCGRYCIHNDGTMDDLQKSVRAIMKQIEQIKYT